MSGVHSSGVLVASFCRNCLFRASESEETVREPGMRVREIQGTEEREGAVREPGMGVREIQGSEERERKGDSERNLDIKEGRR